MFDVLKFLRDYHIDHSMEGSRAKRGWVQVNCPFCGGGVRGYDLGINITEAYGHCWRCRGHHIIAVIRRLAGVNRSEAERIIEQYQNRLIHSAQDSLIQVRRRREVKLPAGCRRMQERHLVYLESRGFDAERLEREFNLMGTGPIGPYKHRIIAPIYFEGRLVSYQGRDITGKVAPEKRYKACPKDYEVIHHKDILYGWDLADGDTAIVVEGITDMWRMGPGTLATFGTGFRREQAHLLAKRFKRVFPLFDPEPQAQEIAEELSQYLSTQGCEVVNVELDEGTDPGDLSQKEANALAQQIGIKGWNS